MGSLAALGRRLFYFCEKVNTENTHIHTQKVLTADKCKSTLRGVQLGGVQVVSMRVAVMTVPKAAAEGWAGSEIVETLPAGSRDSTVSGTWRIMPPNATKGKKPTGVLRDLGLVSNAAVF